MERIKKVLPINDFRLNVELTNGNTVILNMEDKLETIRFSQLSDVNFFAKVTTDGYFLRWGNRVEMSVNEIFKIIQD